MSMQQLATTPLSWLKPDPKQAGEHFDEAELRSLGESMKPLGQLQPAREC
jgi:hypothetical protein